MDNYLDVRADLWCKLRLCLVILGFSVASTCGECFCAILTSPSQSLNIYANTFASYRKALEYLAKKLYSRPTGVPECSWPIRRPAVDRNMFLPLDLQRRLLYIVSSCSAVHGGQHDTKSANFRYILLRTALFRGGKDDAWLCAVSWRDGIDDCGGTRCPNGLTVLSRPTISHTIHLYRPVPSRKPAHTVPSCR